MSWLDSHRIFLLGGPGGVGKTTLAASLAVSLAKRGHKTVVLTVDPARRLAQALGLDSFHSELQPVPLEGHAGKLFASMLDTQRYFDKLMARLAPDASRRERILNHPIYRAMVDTLGGTHEYAAMERLLEFAGDPSWDRVVIDTPPSQNAVDLLSAPQRLADFMDNSVLKWFQGTAPAYLRLFRTGTKVAMKLVQKVFGAEFLTSFASLLSEIEGMQAGFRSRHLEVLELLRGEQSAFLLVTTPTEARFEESRAFSATLRASSIPLRGIVLNRLEPSFPATLESGAANGARAAWDALLSYYDALARLQSRWVEAFEREFQALPVLRAPHGGYRVHELNSLSQLGELLLKLEEHERRSSASPTEAPTTR